MNAFKLLAAVGLVGTTVVAAVPAGAVVTPFATYQSVGPAANLYWLNSGGTNNGSTGADGSLYTIASSGSKLPGSTLVNFSFLQPTLAPSVTNVSAIFTLNASVLSSPAASGTGGSLTESGIGGSFSFVTTSAITIGSRTFAAGSNLLSGVFTPAAIYGQRGATTGTFSASTASSASVKFTSDFLSFTPTVTRSFTISLNSIAGVLQAVPTRDYPLRALRTFRTGSGGVFASDPDPDASVVPEPAVWGMMIVGFGMVGVQVRRRRTVAA